MGEGRRRVWGPVLVPLGLAIVFAALGQVERAAFVSGLAVLCAALIAGGVDVDRAVRRGAERFGHGLGVVGAALVFVVFITPAWAWTRVARRDPLRHRSSAPGWTDRIGTIATDASLAAGAPVAVRRRTFVGRISWAVGCVVLVVAANYFLGWAWDELKPAPAPTPVTYDEAGATKTPPPSGTVPASTAPPVAVDKTKYDPRADVPAMAAYPWRDRYFQDLQRPPTEYWPYTQSRPMPFFSPFINIDGWSRRTYRTPGPAAGRPVVWMFGGSTTFGEGQRDEHTIASVLARLAEEAGTPIEIRNYGQRGWTHFQDMVLYEQLLANEGTPDLAVFYDGVNEVATESFVPEAVPSHYAVEREAAANQGQAFATRFGSQIDTSTVIEDAYYVYSEHSAIHKLVRFLTTSQPAGASPQESDSDDQVVGGQFDITVQDGEDAGKVYMRVQGITRGLSEEHGVPTLFYWQPYAVATEPQLAARAQIQPPTIDISELLLDHQDVYIDGAHTNEEGARIVAERIWEDLGPDVGSWYAEHP